MSAPSVAQGTVPPSGQPLGPPFRPRGLPSAREATDRPLANVAQRLMADESFRQVLREELQAFRQQPHASDGETDQSSEAGDSSWMGAALRGFGQGTSSETMEPLEAIIDPGQPIFEHADEYGPLTQMSQSLRIQAARGFRAGVMELKRGMFLVTEIPESALEPEFGVVAMLAPLALNVASKALENPETRAALLHAAGKGVQATGRGFKAVGRGVGHLVHPRGHGSGRGYSRHHPPAHSALPVPRAGAGQQYAMVPMAQQGFYPTLAPQGYPMAYPGTQASAPYPGGPQPVAYPGTQSTAYPGGQTTTAYPPGGGYPQLPPAEVEAEPLTWAEPSDFQGLIDGSSWLATW